jgi:hypothetical protein
MKTSTTFLEWTKGRFEEIGRARAWAVLRTLDCGLLEQAGIEPELLEKGPEAWPWRAGNDESWSGIDQPTAGASAVGPKAWRDGSESPRTPRSPKPGPRDLVA